LKSNINKDFLKNKVWKPFEVPSYMSRWNTLVTAYTELTI